MAEISFGEYKPDISDLNSKDLRFLSNVLPQMDGYGPINSYVGFTQALPGPCRGFFYARKSDGSVAIFGATSTRLYLLNNTDFSWGHVSKGLVSYPTIPTSGQWQFVQFNNFVIVVQQNVPPQFFDLTSSTQFADLAGSPPQAAYIAVVNRFILLSGLLSQPYRVQWSGLNDVTNWVSGVNFSDFQDLPDGGITRGVGGGEYGLIMQDQSIRRMIYSPGSEFVFQIDRIAQDRGLIAPYSLVPAGERVFFISAQGFIQSDASGVLNPIGEERTDKTFLADYDSGSLQLVIGAADPAKKIVVWVYKSLSGSAGVFDKGLVYSWSLNRWAPINIAGEFMATLSKPGLTLEALDAISSSIDLLPFSLDDISTSALPALGWAGPDNMVGFLSGPNLEATVISSEFSNSPNRILVNGVTPITDAPDVVAAIGTRNTLKQTETPVFTDEAAMNLDGYCPILAEGRYARARFRIPEGSNWTFIRGFEPDVQPGNGK